MIVVRGRTLAGMAAAARLARLGHDVTLAGPEEPTPVHDFLELPAAWRDLFKKTGRPLPGELIRLGASLVPAPATTYLLPDGKELILPDDRGGQYHAITERFGESTAVAWRDLLDELDDVWAALRRFGLEDTKIPESKADRRTLWLDRTIADVADRAGTLAPIVLAQAHFAGTDSSRAPGLLAVRLSMIRTFGRHRLVRDDPPASLPGTTLVELLERRLTERGVRCTDEIPAAEHEVDCRPHLPRSFLSRLRPAQMPTAHETEPGEPAEIIDLTGTAPVRTIRTPSHAITLDYRTTHDDLTAGIAPNSAKAWLARPVPTSSGASAASPAGGEPWAQLLSAALAVYQLHEQLTGEDPRPTNRDFKLPRVHRG